MINEIVDDADGDNDDDEDGRRIIPIALRRWAKKKRHSKLCNVWPHSVLNYVGSCVLWVPLSGKVIGGITPAVKARHGDAYG